MPIIAQLHALQPLSLLAGFLAGVLFSAAVLAGIYSLTCAGPIRPSSKKGAGNGR